MSEFDTFNLTDEEKLRLSRLPTAYRIVVRKILTEYQAACEARVREAEEARPCHFPEHRDLFGNVTHQRFISHVGNNEIPYAVYGCEVCGHVTMEPGVIIG